MNETELLAILARVEDGRHQFKCDFANIDALAAVLIAFANTGGGRLHIGVADDGQVSGLDAADVARLNALVHRDYYISAPIRLLIFTDRVEIISPGHLPNHLDIEQIRFGMSNLRNPALASHAFYMLPYRGLGSGIPRATEAWPDIDLIDDRRGTQFKDVIRRLEVREIKSQPETLQTEQSATTISAF